ncbi:hypothetical protein J6590_059920 [Homalodisca vitripennis]|nr:hypothetical protein J6590_059920 [Homalodisca vitripennis]
MNQRTPRPVEVDAGWIYHLSLSTAEPGALPTTSEQASVGFCVDQRRPRHYATGLTITPPRSEDYLGKAPVVQSGLAET